MKFHNFQKVIWSKKPGLWEVVKERLEEKGGERYRIQLGTDAADQEWALADELTAVTYYRALPMTVTTATPNCYVGDVHFAFDWVTDIKQASSDYRESCEATQQKLKDQLNIETILFELPNEKLMTPMYVVCRAVI